MNIERRFMDLFQGLSRAHGVYIQGKKSAKGKVEGKARTLKEPVTELLWKDHLSGKVGLGIVPVDEEGLTNFGAVDIDQYDLDSNELEERIRSKGLPLIVCKTKSGGAHLYLFLKEKAPAKDVRERLRKWAAQLGYPTAEIFPKQDRIEKEDDCGSWINMPYFFDSRKAVHEGRELTAEEFIALADSMAMIEPDDFEGAPPCLRSLIMGGISEGFRNKVAFMICLYCKMRYGEGWQDEARYRIRKHISSLDQKETQTIVDSARRKSYRYKCGEEPFASLCDKERCREAEHGISEGSSDPGVTMKDLKRIMTEDPMWEMTVNGERLKFESEEDLMQQNRFAKFCFKHLKIFTRTISKEAWRNLMQGLLDGCQDIAAPEDAGPRGEFLALLDKYVSDRSMGKHEDELLTGKPYSENGFIYVRSMELVKWMKKQNVKITPQKAWDYLRDLGATDMPKIIKKKKIRLWILPDSFLNRQKEPLDTPDVSKEKPRF